MDSIVARLIQSAETGRVLLIHPRECNNNNDRAAPNIPVNIDWTEKNSAISALNSLLPQTIYSSHVHNGGGSQDVNRELNIDVM